MYLELFDPAPTEVARGMAFLKERGTSGTTMSVMSQKTMTRTASRGRDDIGCPEPQVELRFARGTPHRVLRAELHKLAADVELATPESTDWIVRTEINDAGRGRVYLDIGVADLALIGLRWSRQQAAITRSRPEDGAHAAGPSAHGDATKLALGALSRRHCGAIASSVTRYFPVRGHGRRQRLCAFPANDGPASRRQ